MVTETTTGHNVAGSVALRWVYAINSRIRKRSLFIADAERPHLSNPSKTVSRRSTTIGTGEKSYGLDVQCGQGHLNSPRASIAFDLMPNNPPVRIRQTRLSPARAARPSSFTSKHTVFKNFFSATVASNETGTKARSSSANNLSPSIVNDQQSSVAGAHGNQLTVPFCHRANSNMPGLE